MDTTLFQYSFAQQCVPQQGKFIQTEAITWDGLLHYNQGIDYIAYTHNIYIILHKY